MKVGVASSGRNIRSSMSNTILAPRSARRLYQPLQLGGPADAPEDDDIGRGHFGNPRRKILHPQPRRIRLRCFGCLHIPKHAIGVPGRVGLTGNIDDARPCDAGIRRIVRM